MKRRDVLRMAPLPLLGWQKSAGIRPKGTSGRLGVLRTSGSTRTEAGSVKAAPFAAEVRPLNGAPSLFLDGKPVFAAINWVSCPRKDKPWEFAEQARQNAETGIHIYAFDVGKGTEWVGPAAGRPSPFDFSTVEARFGQVLKADPHALFHLRIYLEIGHDDWWEKQNPGECEVMSTGKLNGMSFASKLWRGEAKEFLRQYISHLKKTGLSNRVIAYQPGAGHTGEWVKGETSMYWPCGDFSRPMREYFRGWLRARYLDDVERLRRAWGNSGITFETASVPEASRQLEARLYTFRDPAVEQDVIDYFGALAELCADCLIDFCRTIKEETGRQKLAGAFYGYLLDLAWNGGFFKERPDSDYSTYQRGGHLGLRKVLGSPDVDFLVSPYSYGFRGVGGDGPSMLPAESVRRAGKLCLIEDDTRTHADPADKNYGYASTLAESEAVLRRNLAGVLIRGQGLWWARWKVDTVREPAFLRLLKSFNDLGEWSLALDRKSAAEIAVFVDDESFFHETCRNNLDIPLIFQQKLWGLPKTGAPSDIRLLDDFLAGNLRPYKLCIFLNPLRLDQNRRLSMKRELEKTRTTALWIYAPGYIKDSPSLDNMEELTGIKFGSGEQPWGPLVHITNFQHPLTQGLSRDLFWGTNNKLSPVFYVDDQDAEIIGQVVFSQGNCKPGFAVKRMPGWTSVYSAAPNLPANVLRNIARFAGAHIYSDAGDVLYANRHLLCVHTISGGRRIFRLPRKVQEIFDVFSRKTVALGSSEFSVDLKPASTALYYAGESDLVAPLKK